MKILCPVKRVIDYQVKIRVKTDQSGVETSNVPMSMNPFDEIALEQAVRMKEQGLADEVIAVSIGPAEVTETLRKALAHGADKAFLIETSEALPPPLVARCLQACVQQWQPDLVLMGKQAIDDDSNQTGQYLAGLLDWPQATFASDIKIDDSVITVVREVDGGLQTLQMNCPAVITTDLRLNEPRFLSLPNIVKAKQKPIETLSLESLGVDCHSRRKILSVNVPPSRKKGQRLETVTALVHQLREIEGVIS